MKHKNMLNLGTLILTLTLAILLFNPSTATADLSPPIDKLVLWNRLGSEAEVLNSQVGPGGTLLGGSFVEGMFGNAFSANYTQDQMVTFPKEVISTNAGAIEFWAKLTDFPSTINAGHRPGFFQINDGYSGFQLFFDRNNGAGHGGLCGNVGHGFHCGTGAFGSWTYESVLGTGQQEAWHHYALVWDKDGIAGVDNGTRKVAIFLDGQLNCTLWKDYYGSSVEWLPLTSGELGLIYNWANYGTVAMDNIKIWNYAKTDFSDRFDEASIFEISIDIKPGSDANNINLKSRAKVAVAILTTGTFDARSVDPASVRFAGTASLRQRASDVDRDGDKDFVFYFAIQALALDKNSTTATLTGKTINGCQIEGTDTVNIVPKKK
ncbi:MAG: hypothetical protein JXA89_24665 [Anaerolineae bacterium]|nr:hypothetical protein [Anaerolineae bacterium]